MGIITNKFEEKYYGFLFHYYRAEVYRETSWRSRLDVTTNWAVIVTASILSFVFGQFHISHVVIIINKLIVWFFLYVEARRFRYYSRVRDRVKFFERNLLGPLFNGSSSELKSQESLREIGDKLINPKINMTNLEALSWRLRRNYIFIFLIIFMVWLYKIMTFPVQIVTLGGIFANARVGVVPGSLVFITMTLVLITEFWLAFRITKNRKREDLP